MRWLSREKKKALAVVAKDLSLVPGNQVEKPYVVTASLVSESRSEMGGAAWESHEQSLACGVHQGNTKETISQQN